VWFSATAAASFFSAATTVTFDTDIILCMCFVRNRSQYQSTDCKWHCEIS
jgi:hypothetical protein